MITLDRGRRMLRLKLLIGSLSVVPFLPTPASGQVTTTYSYDALGRLTTVAHSGQANNGLRASYCYDPAGNRSRVLVGSSTLTCSSPLPPPRKLPSDFNGDGRDDILWRSLDGYVSDWTGTATGGFVDNVAQAGSYVATDFKIVATGSLNGDKAADILWRNMVNGDMYTQLGNTAGGFSGTGFYTVGLTLDWKVAGVGDVNGDGIGDILLRNDNGWLAEWVVQADGNWHNNDSFGYLVSTAWQIVAIGDVNGDKRADLIWRHTNGDLAEWLGQPNGTFSDQGLIAGPFTNDWHVAGIGDFNGDGIDDLLFRNDNGWVASWLFQPDGRWHNDDNAGALIPVDWQIVQIGDYNGDGRSDILWRHSSGALSNWLGNPDGSFTINDANAWNVVGNNWYVQGPVTYRLPPPTVLNPTVEMMTQQPVTIPITSLGASSVAQSIVSFALPNSTTGSATIAADGQSVTYSETVATPPACEAPWVKVRTVTYKVGGAGGTSTGVLTANVTSAAGRIPKWPAQCN